MHANRHIIATTIDLEGASFAETQIDQASLSNRIEVKIEDIAHLLPIALFLVVLVNPFYDDGLGS